MKDLKGRTHVGSAQYTRRPKAIAYQCQLLKSEERRMTSISPVGFPLPAVVLLSHSSHPSYRSLRPFGPFTRGLVVLWSPPRKPLGNPW